MKGLEKSALSVSAVAFFISDLIKHQLSPVLIKGEISNLQKRSYSSYIRFSLKDKDAKIDCLSHSSTNAAKLIQHLQEGDEVIIFAQANYYQKTGQISFFTEEMMKLGEGIFYSKLEKLKQQLYEEQLFDSSKKKTLPKYPDRIGIITSADGAALQDILRVAKDRYPIAKISIFPSLVQGIDAAHSLCTALEKAFKSNLDAIIIGRGGGSKEDLDAFNNETLVRLIASSKIPIISAVGHEIDTSLTDYAADVSAPTPTGAAMILFPDKNELLKELQTIKQTLYHKVEKVFQEEQRTLDLIKDKLTLLYKEFLAREKHNLKILSLTLLESYPEHILKKGYALIKQTNPELHSGSIIEILTHKNIITAVVEKIIVKENPYE